MLVRVVSFPPVKHSLQKVNSQGIALSFQSEINAYHFSCYSHVRTNFSTQAVFKIDASVFFQSGCLIALTEFSHDKSHSKRSLKTDLARGWTVPLTRLPFTGYGIYFFFFHKQMFIFLCWKYRHQKHITDLTFRDVHGKADAGFFP